MKGHNFDDITGRIIGAAIEVHKQLGPGFQEVVYQRALAWELEALGIDFAREENVPIFYKDRHIDTRRVDFVISDCIVELKARREMLKEDSVQTVSYLKASKYPVALLINFGAERVQVKRFVGIRNSAETAEKL
ncbi:MAG: GxxExxY protein [Armatimonadetes bacterium]|nr:GxxExxY protein [Armatimonadota bacterium]